MGDIDFTNSKQESHSTPEGPIEREQLLNVAVVIMGAISCYTTAVGIAPMLNNKFFAFAIAVALSLFMIVIAISIPRTTTKTKKRGAVFAYSLVALFSVLLNFNAIYGIANAKTLLYEELDAKRSNLVKLQSLAISDIDTLHQVTRWEGELEAAQEKMEGEKRTPGEEGCGPKCRKIYREEVLPAMGELKKAKEKAQKYHDRIEKRVSTIYPEPINTVLQNANPKELRVGIEDVVEVYNDISGDIGVVTQKNYSTINFENKNVGNLNHALNTIFNIGRKGGEATAAILVSLLISILIDFLILFVILFLAPQVEKEQPKESFQGLTRGNGNSRKPTWKIPEALARNRSSSKSSRSQNGPFVNRK